MRRDKLIISKVEFVINGKELLRGTMTSNLGRHRFTLIKSSPSSLGLVNDKSNQTCDRWKPETLEQIRTHILRSAAVQDRT